MNNENIEQENKRNCIKMFNLKKVFTFLLVVILLIMVINHKTNQYNSVIFENDNIKIEYGPKRTINDYSYIIELGNGDTLLVGGYTYQDGSVCGGKQAELYSAKENKFYKLPNTVNNFSTLRKTAINNNKVLLESKDNKIEIYDIEKQNFFQPNKEIFVENFKKNDIPLMITKQITINETPYYIHNLDEKYDLLIENNDNKTNNLSYKLYNKQNKNIMTIPKLKYTPFSYRNENLIKIGNRKFLIPLNYDKYTILPTYKTLIITIKE